MPEKIKELRFCGVLYCYHKGTLFFAVKVRSDEERAFLRSIWRSKEDGRTCSYQEVELRSSSMFHLRAKFEDPDGEETRVYFETEVQTEAFCYLWERKHHRHQAKYRVPSTYYMAVAPTDPPQALTWGEFLDKGSLKNRLNHSQSLPKEKGWVPF